MLAGAALAAALAVGLGSALARPDSGSAAAVPGVTETEFLVGGTAPLSGPASAYASIARGAEAYLHHVNARGGVHGRAVRYRYLDDAYNPAQSVQATRQLVEQDGVFAVFNSLGTEHNVAVRSYLNARKVPQLFVASGATTFGRDAARWPWTIGFQPSYAAEGWIYGTFLARTRRDARVGVLFQNDEYGKDLLAGLRGGLGRSGARVVATQSYETAAPDVASQVAALKASGADVLVLFATPKFATQAYLAATKLAWRPLVLVNAVANASNVLRAAVAGGAGGVVRGSLSVAYLKDPTDPRWADDPGMRLYRNVLARHAPRANRADAFHVYGMAVAHELVRVLRAAGPQPTRAKAMAAARRLTDPANPFLLPGIVVRTGPGDGFPVEHVLLQRWQDGRWSTFGGLWGPRR